MQPDKPAQKSEASQPAPATPGLIWPDDMVDSEPELFGYDMGPARFLTTRDIGFPWGVAPAKKPAQTSDESA